MRTLFSQDDFFPTESSESAYICRYAGASLGLFSWFLILVFLAFFLLSLTLYFPIFFSRLKWDLPIPNCTAKTRIGHVTQRTGCLIGSDYDSYSLLLLYALGTVYRVPGVGSGCVPQPERSCVCLEDACIKISQYAINPPQEHSKCAFPRNRSYRPLHHEGYIKNVVLSGPLSAANSFVLRMKPVLHPRNVAIMISSKGRRWWCGTSHLLQRSDADEVATGPTRRRVLLAI